MGRGAGLGQGSLFRKDAAGAHWQPPARAGEYDVPKGALGMPGMSVGSDGTYVYTIQSSWPVQDMVTPPTLPAMRAYAPL